MMTQLAKREAVAELKIWTIEKDGEQLAVRAKNKAEAVRKMFNGIVKWNKKNSGFSSVMSAEEIAQQISEYKILNAKTGE